MQTSLDCLPCFLWQALNLARRFSSDPAVHEKILRETLRFVADLDYAESPPVVARHLHRRLRELTGIADPYAEDKRRHNEMMLALLPALQAQVTAAPDPLALATRFAIAGNVIDLGVRSDLTTDGMLAVVRAAANQPLAGDFPGFATALARARNIIYLADNAGEIVLDRLLLALLPRERVTVVVRGAAIINDAIMADAQQAGLPDMVTVIDNGSDAPGTLVEECSTNFQERFAAADLIVAKGQGNFETLAGRAEPIWCLFRVKCAAVAAVTGLPAGSHAVVRAR